MSAKNYVVPGEYILAKDDIEINAGRKILKLKVTNKGDRPIQVGSHFHFAETNSALDFDRKAAETHRLGKATGDWTDADYITGVQMYFPTFFIRYAFLKTVVFAFIIATVPAYFGYNVKGGSLEVGRASTKAVVWTIVSIIIANLVLTQMFLST